MTLVISKENAEAAIKKARELRQSGFDWKHISQELGISTDWLRRRLDPPYALRVREYDRVRLFHTRRGRPKKCQWGSVAREVRIDGAARLAEIPPDTRDITGRAFGDPLPGRSALCRRASE